MKRVLVTLRGKNPGYLMNPATQEVVENIRTKTSPPRRRDWTAKVECETKLCWGDHWDEPGKLGIPVNNLFACLVEAGRSVKVGKTQISTASSTKLLMYVEPEGDFLPFIGEDVEASWVPTVMRGTNPNGGEMVAVTRPLFKRWEVEASILVDEKAINDAVVQQLFDIAGKTIGLGDFRPQKRGRFGRFAVANWVDLGEVEVDDYGVAVTTNGHADISREELAEVTS